MKNKLIVAALSAGFPMFFAACGGDHKIVEENDNVTPVVELVGYKYDAIASLPDSLVVPVEGGRYARVSGQGMLPRKIGKRDISELRDSLERLGAVLIIDNDNTEPRLNSGMALVEIEPDDSVAGTAVYNQLSIALMTPQVVVWKNYSYSYLCRAAHGTYNTTYVNYCISQGKILSLSDVFKPGYERELTNMLRSKLKDRDYDLITPIGEIGIPTDFEITENGINFIYGLYEIAPYSSGEITVEFDSYELDDLFIADVRQLLYGVMQ